MNTYSQKVSKFDPVSIKLHEFSFFIDPLLSRYNVTNVTLIGPDISVDLTNVISLLNSVISGYIVQRCDDCYVHITFVSKNSPLVLFKRLNYIVNKLLVNCHITVLDK